MEREGYTLFRPKIGLEVSGCVMFLGQYAHTLDGKGRLILPARFRWLLTQAYVSSQTEGCLALWAPAAFEARAEEMTAFMRGDVTSRDRNMARVFFAGAQEANPDSQGRIAIPQNLRNFAGLTKSVMVNGAGDHVEIWDADTWARIQGDGEAALHSTEPSATSDATELVGAPA